MSSERGFQTDERDIARSREKRRDRGSNGAISNNELTEKNLVETHEGGLEQDDTETKNKIEEALGAGAKVLDWSDQAESSFGELYVAETEKLSENNPGELGDVVKMRDEFENKKGRGEA